MKYFIIVLFFIFFIGCGGSNTKYHEKEILTKFAPFYPVGSRDINLSSDFTYSFIITDGDSCKAHWDWDIDSDIDKYKLNKNGIISFGGAGAEEKSLAYVCDEDELLNAYKNIIDTYNIKWLDFDIEGEMLDETSSNIKRFKVLKQLKTIYPDINISLTLPIMPEGFDENVKDLITLAKKENLSITSYNLMLMDYGESYEANDSNKTLMFDYSKQAIQNANNDLKEIFNTNKDFYSNIGAIAMIGVNDVENEIFYRNDFALLRDFVIEKKMPFLSFWSILRDKNGTSISDSSGLEEEYGKMEYEYFKIGEFVKYGVVSRLNKNDTFYWQLTDTLKKNIPAKIYDVDLFDTDKDIIKRLKNNNKVVICYMDAGTWEEWRSDADSFPDDIIGKDVDGWEGEKWLDIRRDALKEIIKKRLNLAKQKGCDGIEPDNIDGYQNDTGFDLSFDEQLDYNIFLAREAKKRGLIIALKNDLDQADELVNFYDFLIAESALKYDESDKFLPFIVQNKPIFDIEYDEDDYNCSKAKNFHLLLLPKDLDGSFVKSCDY